MRRKRRFKTKAIIISTGWCREFAGLRQRRLDSRSQLVQQLILNRLEYRMEMKRFQKDLPTPDELRLPAEHSFMA
jgi:hypothetical protein